VASSFHGASCLLVTFHEEVAFREASWVASFHEVSWVAFLEEVAFHAVAFHEVAFHEVAWIAYFREEVVLDTCFLLLEKDYFWCCASGKQ
jgi:hypothetical protein